MLLKFCIMQGVLHTVHVHVQESWAFAKAASLDTHKALVHIFFAQRATKKVRPRASCPAVRSVSGVQIEPRPGC